MSIVGSFGGQNQVEMRFKSQGGRDHARYLEGTGLCMLCHAFIPHG